MIFSKPVFQFWPEVPDKTLDWPSSAVSQSADSVALNLFAQFPNHINLLWLCVALSHSVIYSTHQLPGHINPLRHSNHSPNWQSFGYTVSTAFRIPNYRPYAGAHNATSYRKTMGW